MTSSINVHFAERSCTWPVIELVLIGVFSSLEKSVTFTVIVGFIMNSQNLFQKSAHVKVLSKKFFLRKFVLNPVTATAFLKMTAFRLRQF